MGWLPKWTGGLPSLYGSKKSSKRVFNSSSNSDHRSASPYTSHFTRPVSMPATLDFSKGGNFAASQSKVFDLEKGKAGGGGEKPVGNGGGVLEDMSDSCKLSWKQRLIGFVACAVVGVVLGFLGYFFIAVKHDFRRFAIVFTLGSIVTIMSTAFLMGPMNQFRLMLQKGRIYATLTWVVAMGLTLFFGFKKKTVPTVLFMVLQILAFIWYSLTYIPFVLGMLTRAIKKPFKDSSGG